MTKTELAEVIANNTGLPKAQTYNALSALEQQLIAQGKALRAVQLDNFGTFKPRQNMGQRTGKSFNASTITYDNWKLVVDPKLVSQTTFVDRAAKLAGMAVADFEQVLTQFKTQLERALRRGRSIYFHELGTFKVGRRKTRIYRAADGSISSQKPAHFVVIFKSNKSGPHQKFVPAPGFVWGK
jgi:nucleoid DNA-binding protein